MNYFAHALPFLDDRDPYFLAGTSVPDWMAVVDRRARLRRKNIEPFQTEADPIVAAVSRGVLQHLRDDAAFHGTRAFAEISLQITVWCRDSLGDEAGFRPSFLGHLLTEVLLDDALIADNSEALDSYYRAIASVDAQLVQEVVSRLATRPTDRLAWMITEFNRLRILSDYREDGKLWGRLNQVMRRAKLESLPEEFCDVLPLARQLVNDRKTELLDGIPTKPEG